jgi:predicted dehydrogenase
MSAPTAFTRRQFLGTSALATAALATGCQSAAGPRRISPNEKLNLGVVGVGGRGAEDLAGVASQNIVALCDVDSGILAGAKAKFPGAATYSDFRRMLDRKDLDGVVIGTPDHTHAVIAVAALQSGRHTYCEKPLTHTISELRRMEEVARKSGLQTQTGNQIHATRNYRRVVELIQGNVIGPVREVHHWAGSVWETKPWPKAEPVPATLDYEQWIGPVKEVPFSKEFVPFNWRRWWHFGGGTLTDFCCHHIDLGAWALQLGLPTVIEADGPTPDQHCAPTGLHVRYEFPGRGHLPPVTMHWYSGAGRPQIVGVPDLSKWGGGSLFIGDQGMLLADYGRHVLLPEEKFKGATLPPSSLAESVGHHEEWIRACKGENLALSQFAALGKTNSPFSYGALLTEIGLLGNIAFRTGKRIEWDADNMKAKGVPEADRLIHHEYRPGWKLG